jgi:hypothetical protein
MRSFILAAALGAIVIPATAASTQGWHGDRGRSEFRHDARDCRRDLRRADNRREYRRAQRDCRRDFRDDRRDQRRWWDGHRWRNR